MHRWARFIVVLVLAAALPLQGIAAATLQLCAPPPEAAVPIAPAPHVTVAAHFSPHAMHHQHHGAGETVTLARSDTEQQPHAAPVVESKCSVCAACCAGAALPASSIEFGDAAPEDALLPSFQSPTPAFLTAGLERPPRTFLA